jgi:membrane-bound ClpP family serine protease
VTGGLVDLVSEPSGLTERQLVANPIPGLVDLVVPSLRQLVQQLDGVSFEVEGVVRTLSTITDQVPGSEVADGVTTIPVSFSQPGLFHRFLHLSARPEAAFFFLVAGLTLAAFEFFALGPGLGAALSGLSLLLAGYGMAVLPTRWLAVAVTAIAIGLFTVSNQKGGVLGLGLLATVLLAWAGFNFSLGSPQVRSGVPGVLFSVMAVLFFFVLAIPTVGRARFSTQTIGRTGLIGRRGTAVADFSPDGVVEIDGARWPAIAHREAGIKVGSPVVVTSVEGARVEVDQAE